MGKQAQLFDSSYRRSLLESLDIFHGVAPDDVAALLGRCERRELDAGDVLLSPEAPNDHLYLVLSGSLLVRVGSADAPVLTTFGAGACAGEMAIDVERNPAAWVMAAEFTEVLSISSTVLTEMLDRSHQFAKNLLRIQSNRLRELGHYVAAHVGELQRAEREAMTDGLTGLGNRHAMEASFPEAIARCRREDKPVSLIMIDVDNFKLFNDRFGHVAGDRALGAISRILRKHFRTRDILVRFGGDEFVVLLPGVAKDAALEVARRVLIAVNGDHKENDDSLIRIPLEISLGIAELGPDDTCETLLRAADAALYRAKNAGRNRVSD